MDFNKGDRIQQSLLTGAQRLRNEIRRAAPKQKYQPTPISSRTTKSGLPSIFADPGYQKYLGKATGGNLKRGIVAQKYKRYTPGNPAVFVGIAYKYAPHAWLVEHGAARGTPAIAGTRRGKPTGAKALHFMWGGKQWFLKRATPGPMPAHPFFHPTVERNRKTTEDLISLSAVQQIKWTTANFNYLKAQ